MDEKKMAPGAPGSKPVWTSGAKTGIGKTINAGAKLVFTIGSGIINEVYYPREDIACIKDIGYVVTDGKDFFSEIKCDADSKTIVPEEGIPAYKIVNTCIHKKYKLENEIITDTLRDTLLQRIKFTPQKAFAKQLKLFVIVSPHIHNRGSNNNGWIGDYKGTQMLFAEEDGITIAVACSVPFIKRSVGYAGVSDGWHDLHQHKKMEWEYSKADKGNIVLTAELDSSKNDPFVLAIGFGSSAMEAGNRAVASILDGFEDCRKRYIEEWKGWHKTISLLNKRSVPGKFLKTSATVLKMSEAKSFPGGITAALSVPWGMARTDDDLGGYHLVWPRDLTQCGGSFVALHAYEDAEKVVNYLMSTQEADGRWMQNMWLEGEAYWTGVQMDQLALPIILIESCFSSKIITKDALLRYWPRIKRTLSYLVINGPYTEQDRWEQQPGLNVFTIATEVAALHAAALLADTLGEKELALYCRETADYWNDNIERWTYVQDSSFAKQFDVPGHYIRTNPFKQNCQEVRERPIAISHYKREEVKVEDFVCVDALALVRFGLRKPDDPRILDTIKIIDGILKAETPNGDSWRRFYKDPYGEDDNGNPFIRTSLETKGRAWPLLTGERAHYEIAAGNMARAKELLKAMEAFADNGYISEQVWDTADIPHKNLYFGKPTGSAMPLSWAHAEYIKLCLSLKHKKVMDMPAYTKERYIEKDAHSNIEVWRFDWPAETIQRGQILRVEVLASAIVHWTQDEWQTIQQTPTVDTTLGIHYVDIFPQNVDATSIQFTFFWDANCWERQNFVVKIL